MHRLTRALGVAIAAVGLLSLVACGDDDEGTEPSTTTTSAATTSSTDAPAEATAVKAYFLRDEKVGPVPRTVDVPAVAREAMLALLAGPSPDEREAGLVSTIPDGTELLDVAVADGVATVDLSAEFGSGGGSASMRGRVAQVVFTLTQFSTVESVAFRMDGQPVTALGGEGVLLEDPQSRADWEDLAPAILVESPLPFEAVSSPLRITGTANTFEAAFHVIVTDGDGLIVYDEPAMATSGTGTRGTFDVEATFDVPRAGVGSVIVFEVSARDGSRTNLVEIPVRIS